MEQITEKRITEDFIAMADATGKSESINGGRYELCMAFVPAARRAGFDFMTETRRICERAFRAGAGALNVLSEYFA